MERIVFFDWNDRSLAPAAAMRVQHWATESRLTDLIVTSRGLELNSYHRGGLKSTMRTAFALLGWTTPSQDDPLASHFPQIVNKDNLNPSDLLLGFNWTQIDETRYRVVEVGHPNLVDRIHLFGQFVTGQPEEIQDPEDQSRDIRLFLADQIRRESSRKRAIEQIEKLLGYDPTVRLEPGANPHKLRRVAQYLSAARRIDTLSKLLVRKVAAGLDK